MALETDTFTFGLVHGAWHGAWCWELLEEELQDRGHETVAVDLPIDDPKADYNAHAQIVAEAVEGRENLVLVGHSRGGNIIPRVAGKVATEKMIFVCGAFHATLPEEQAYGVSAAPVSAMPRFTAGIIPIGNNLAQYDPVIAREVFYPDCSDDLADWAVGKLRPQRRAVEPRLEQWPDVPAAYLLCQEDRVINPAWSRYAARRWLGVEAVELPGGHSPFLSRPRRLAIKLLDLARK